MKRLSYFMLTVGAVLVLFGLTLGVIKAFGLMLHGECYETHCDLCQKTLWEGKGPAIASGMSYSGVWCARERAAIISKEITVCNACYQKYREEVLDVVHQKMEKIRDEIKPQILENLEKQRREKIDKIRCEILELQKVLEETGGGRTNLGVDMVEESR